MLPRASPLYISNPLDFTSRFTRLTKSFTILNAIKWFMTSWRRVLMVVDAAFTSMGLNYFTAVVPKVEEFSRKFIETGRIESLKNLAEADIDELKECMEKQVKSAMIKRHYFNLLEHV